MQRLEKIASRMEKVSLKMSTNGSSPNDIEQKQQLLHLMNDNAVLTDYDENVLRKGLVNFTKAAKSLTDVEGDGDHSADALDRVVQATDSLFNKTRLILEHFLGFRAPGQSQSNQLCVRHLGQFLNEDIKLVERVSSKIHRDHPHLNHIASISASLPALYWFSVEEPVTFVTEMIRASEFYSNRIMTEKKLDTVHSSFVRSYIDLLTSLLDFVRLHYPAGAQWSRNESFPICDPEKIDHLFKDAKKNQNSPNQSFPINQELQKTSETLKSVKHSTFTNQKIQSSTSPMSPITPPKPKQTIVEPQQAKVQLTGQRWLVEKGYGPRRSGSTSDGSSQYHVTVPVGDMKQSVYVIDCSHTVIRIAGQKVNSISLDSCQKLDVIIDGVVVSQLECINCKSIRVHAMNSLQTVTVDKTCGFHLFISSTDSNCQLYSSLSSELTMSVKDPESDESFVDHAVPMQLVTTYDKCTSSVSTSVAVNPCSGVAV